MDPQPKRNKNIDVGLSLAWIPALKLGDNVLLRSSKDAGLKEKNIKKLKIKIKINIDVEATFQYGTFL